MTVRGWECCGDGGSSRWVGEQDPSRPPPGCGWAYLGGESSSGIGQWYRNPTTEDIVRVCDFESRALSYELKNIKRRSLLWVRLARWLMAALGGSP